MKTQFELDTLEINRDSLKEIVNELKELNSNLLTRNIIKLYEMGYISRGQFNKAVSLKFEEE